MLGGVPRWTVWSVLLGLVVAVGVTLVVDEATADQPLDRAHLDRYVLQSSDDVDGLGLIASFTEVDASLSPKSGAAEAVSTVFSDLEMESQSVAQALRGWTPGHRVVVSEAFAFESVSQAADFISDVWSDYALGTLERQRGPDGSLLMFHPEFDRGVGTRTAPTAVAAWRFDREVLIVTYVGAESATDALDLARVVDGHRGPEYESQ